MIKKVALTLTGLLGLAVATGFAAGKTYVFGVVAKSNNNPVFQAAKTGAEDEAKALSEKNGVTIKIDWRTPNEEDAQKQVEASNS
jgi:ribose transport system substrate-binding protein